MEGFGLLTCPGIKRSTSCGKTVGIESLKPRLDIAVRCSLRVWVDRLTSHRSLHVFMHPKEWHKISLRDGAPMRVRCEGYDFETVVANWGEHYRSGNVDETVARSIRLTPGDYDAIAEVVWEKAIPELVQDELVADVRLCEVWRNQDLDSIREQINTVRRAKKESNRVERQLRLIQMLREQGAKN